MQGVIEQKFTRKYNFDIPYYVEYSPDKLLVYVNFFNFWTRRGKGVNAYFPFVYKGYSVILAEDEF